MNNLINLFWFQIGILIQYFRLYYYIYNPIRNDDFRIH